MSAAGLLGYAYAGAVLLFAATACALIWRGLDRLDDAQVARRLGLAVFAAALLYLPYGVAAIELRSDEPQYLLIAQSLVLDGDVDLANDYAGDRYASFYSQHRFQPDERDALQTPTGFFSIRDLGLPFTVAVPFALGGRAGALALVCAVAALLVAQLYGMLRDLGVERRLAFLAVALLGFAHPIFTYTSLLFPELFAALLFATVGRAVARGADSRAADLARAGFLAGVIPWFTTRADPLSGALALVVGALAILPAWRARDARLGARRVAFAALAYMLPLLALCALNLRLFQLFMPGAGYYLIRTFTPIGSPIIGGIGLFFDRVFGLVAHAPIYLLAFVGAGALPRARPRAVVATLGLGWLASFGFVALLESWHADWSPAPRYLVAGLPFLVACAGLGLARVGAQGRASGSGSCYWRGGGRSW